MLVLLPCLAYLGLVAYLWYKDRNLKWKLLEKKYLAKSVSSLKLIIGKFDQKDFQKDFLKGSKMTKKQLVKVLLDHDRSTENTSIQVPIQMKEKLWFVFFGRSDFGKCICCSTLISKTADEWEARHIYLPPDDLNSLANLRPVCQVCSKDLEFRSIPCYIQEKGFSPDRSIEGL